ncbi:MAG: hypothetical protein ACAH82_04220 [Solirubrobacteraceae bacterium]
MRTDGMTTAAEQGRLWSAHAADWAAQETMEPERFEPAAALVRPGDAVLEVGCGSGVFLRMASERGAALPYADLRFDLVAAPTCSSSPPTWSPRCARRAGWRGPARR